MLRDVEAKKFGNCWILEYPSIVFTFFVHMIIYFFKGPVIFLSVIRVLILEHRAIFYLEFQDRIEDKQQ